MSMEELAKKAIEESNGKDLFYGVGNSSRRKERPARLLSNISRLINLIQWSMSGSSQRTIRFLSSCQRIP